jgi:hypothetical protein
MSQWLRVFSTSMHAPAPADLLAYLRELSGEARGDFQGDAQGWFRVDLDVGAGRPPLRLERYLAAEEGIRHELNAWAAWVETFETHHAYDLLMQHLTATAQIFTLQSAPAGESADSIDELQVGICRFLARATGGIYQVDGQGFYRADGTLLLAED